MSQSPRDTIDRQPAPPRGASGWAAHSRWPTSGLITGAAIGAILGFLFGQSAWITLGSTIGLALFGCFVGWALANLIFPKR